MKKIFSTLTSVSLLFLIGCKKGDTAGDFAALGIGSYVTKVAIGNGIIDYANLATTKIDITVREYGTPVDKIKIFVSKGAATTDKTQWKAVKEVTYNGDTKLEVSALEIATGLGIPPAALETGETYTLYNQVISKDGQTHDITNMNSAMYGSPNYNTLMTWNGVVACPFRASDWGGVGATFSARVLEDGWADYSPGDIISGIQISGASQLTFPRIFATNPSSPVIVNIAAATGAATVAKQQYGCYGIDCISCQSSGTNNWVFSCANKITLTLTHTQGSTGYGTYVLRLQKL